MTTVVVVVFLTYIVMPMVIGMVMITVVVIVVMMRVFKATITQSRLTCLSCLDSVDNQNAPNLNAYLAACLDVAVVIMLFVTQS